MKSRLIKFACHQCGTKLAVPPEMAGVTDQCPKCGTTITAPPESTLEPVRRKTKFAPVPKAETEAEGQYPSHPQPQHELPVLPGWSASELADALKPPAPMPQYVPHGHAQVPVQPQLHAAEHSLLPDPPAVPDPGPVFMPKRKARSEEGTVAVAPPPPPPPLIKNEHPVLGSILDAPTLPRARAATATTPPPWETPIGPQLPAPASLPQPEALPPLEQQQVEPAPATSVSSVPPLPPPPLSEVTPAPELAPPPVLIETPEPVAPLQEQAQEQSPSGIAPPHEPKSLVAALTAEPLEAPRPSDLTPEVPSAPIALVPESLPDARAAEEAAMPGMGEVLAGGQIAQDPAAPPDARDHRPLLHVPFLPVAESPAKGRRTQKRKLYIIGVVLFLVFDVCVGVWLLNARPEALSEAPPAQNPPAPTPPTPSTPSGDNAAAPPGPGTGTPKIAAPSDLAVTQPESTKPAKPPMAIPLPGHSATDVPTATPVPVAEASPPTDSKKATDTEATPPATAPPAAAGMNPAPAPAATPDPAPPSGKESTRPENAVAAGPDEPSWLLKAGPKSANAGAPAGPNTPASTTPAPTSPAPPTPAPAPAPGSADTTVAAMMGPQPTPATGPTSDGGDPPWLRRIQPTFPAIDGTPLLPSAPEQPVGPPPPMPPPPGAVDGSAIPSLASTTNMPVTPSTPPAPGANGETAPATAAKAPSIVGKVTEEAKSALEVLTKFLAAPTWQERSKYVQKPEATKPAMEKHAAKYGDGPINPGIVKFVDRHPGRDGGPPYCMFEIEGGDLKHEVLVLIEQPAEGEPKIDWPTFVEFKDDLLLRFLETQGEPNQSFRVMLSRKHYFAKDVPDLASKDSFQVQQPNDRFDGHVFLPKSTQLSKKLATQLGWNQNMPVIVELAWRTNGKLHWVEIVRIVSYGWRS